MMAFVGISSIIFQETFGLSEFQYSIYFAVNAGISVVAALAYIRISQIIKPLVISHGKFCPGYRQWRSHHPFWRISSRTFPRFDCNRSAAFALQRAPAMSLLLEQQEKNTGSATSLMNFVFGIFGSLGLVIHFLRLEQPDICFRSNQYNARHF